MRRGRSKEILKKVKQLPLEGASSIFAESNSADGTFLVPGSASFPASSGENGRYLKECERRGGGPLGDAPAARIYALASRSADGIERKGRIFEPERLSCFSGYKVLIRACGRRWSSRQYAGNQYFRNCGSRQDSSFMHGAMVPPGAATTSNAKY